MNKVVDYICHKVLNGGYEYLLISGNGGAGKSTFAKILQDILQQKQKVVQIFSTDDFMLDKAYRKQTIINYIGKNGERKNAYLASTFPEAYDFNRLTSELSASKADIKIVEGIGVALILDNFANSYRIFMQVDKETEYKRRIQRARKGADLTKERMDIRYEQFELFILPLSNKFDLNLISQDDYSCIVVNEKR